MKKVSIIVPVYKVEKYLKRSMDSLVGQTLEDVEIICINDGSPDNSLNILKEYQKKYPDKVVIIDKKNEGVWKGRYDGIKKATGEYIAFVDSDDYVSLDYAEKLYKSAKETNADITVCGFYRVDTETEHIFSTEMTQYNGKIISMSKNPEDIMAINGAPWNKLFKAKVLKNMKNLDKPPKILDDMMFQLLAYLNVKKITFIGDALYYYMVRAGSIITSIKQEQIASTEEAMIQIKKIYASNKSGKKLLEVIDDMAFIHFGLSLMFRISNDKNCNFKEELKKNRKFLNENFSMWRKSKYLNISYTLKHKCNFRSAVMKKIYVLHLYRAFLVCYKFMINVFKVDIKW